MNCKHQLQLSRAHRTAVCLALLVVFGGFASTIVDASSPRDYLQHDWYVLEVVVFEPDSELPSSEHLLHGVSQRTLPSNVRSLTFSVAEEQAALRKEQANPVEYRSEEFKQTSASVGESEAISPLLSGCWLHSEISASSEDSSNALSDEPNNREEEASVEPTGSNLFAAVLERDSSLPDWLPDHWESTEAILQRTGRTLGLCDEDIRTLLSYELDIADQIEEGDAQRQVSVSQVQEAFALHERELLASVGRRIPSDQLNLRRTANRLQTEGYRVIEHVAWHQDALAPGSSNSTLVQFGNIQRNLIYEIEGTLDLSVARFLHLDLEIWKSIPQSRQADSRRAPSPRFMFYLLDESRRLALGETHYFDHPKFGMLIQVRRLSIPPNLVALVQELDS